MTKLQETKKLTCHALHRMLGLVATLFMIFATASGCGNEAKNNNNVGQQTESQQTVSEPPATPPQNTPPSTTKHSDEPESTIGSHPDTQGHSAGSRVIINSQPADPQFSPAPEVMLGDLPVHITSSITADEDPPSEGEEASSDKVQPADRSTTSSSYSPQYIPSADDKDLLAYDSITDAPSSDDSVITPVDSDHSINGSERFNEVVQNWHDEFQYHSTVPRKAQQSNSSASSPPSSQPSPSTIGQNSSQERPSGTNNEAQNSNDTAHPPPSSPPSQLACLQPENTLIKYHNYDYVLSEYGQMIYLNNYNDRILRAYVQFYSLNVSWQRLSFLTNFKKEYLTHLVRNGRGTDSYTYKIDDAVVFAEGPGSSVPFAAITKAAVTQKVISNKPETESFNITFSLKPYRACLAKYRYAKRHGTDNPPGRPTELPFNFWAVVVR